MKGAPFCLQDSLILVMLACGDLALLVCPPPQMSAWGSSMGQHWVLERPMVLLVGVQHYLSRWPSPKSRSTGTRGPGCAEGRGSVPRGGSSGIPGTAPTCPCLCPAQVNAVGYGMDEVEQDQHEARLKELFDSFDTTGTGSLGQEELTDLCHMLSLEEVAPVLQETLLQDNLLGRVRLGKSTGSGKWVRFLSGHWGVGQTTPLATCF